MSCYFKMLRFKLTLVWIVLKKKNMKDISSQKKSVNKLKTWTKISQRAHSLNILNSDKDIIINLFKKAYENNDIELKHVDTRKRKFVETQAIVVAVVYEYFKLTLSQIGFIIGKHHATTLHYINLYEDVLCSDKDNRDLYIMLSMYVNKEIYGDNGSRSYDLESKDNKELKAMCKGLIIENRKLLANMHSIKALVNV